MAGFRAFPIALFIAASVALASCGRGEQHNQQGAVAGNGAAQGDDVGPLKDIATADAGFTQPIYLHLDQDNFAAARYIQSLKGGPVDYWATQGNVHCPENGYGPAPTISAHIDGYDTGAQQTLDWLRSNSIITFANYSVSYTNSPSGPLTRNYTCVVVGDAVTQYASGPIHAGTTVALAHRASPSWTYANSYDADVPGKGRVKMFAGSYSYTMQPNVPWVSFSGSGTATMKMYLDPDNGKWTMLEAKYADPGIVLVNGAPVAAPSAPGAPAASPDVTEIAQGVAHIRQTAMFDFDNGAAALNGKDADVLLQSADGSRAGTTLLGQNGAAIIMAPGYDKLAPKDCRLLSYPASGGTPLSMLSSGEYGCIRTRKGHLGEVRFLTTEGDGHGVPYTVNFEFHIWNEQAPSQSGQ